MTFIPDSNQPLKDPLHGMRLVDILEYLVREHGWEEMGQTVNIRCFNSDPSINSSLKFLRKTHWARREVEEMYIRSVD